MSRVFMDEGLIVLGFPLSVGGRASVAGREFME